METRQFIEWLDERFPKEDYKIEKTTWQYGVIAGVRQVVDDIKERLKIESEETEDK